MNVKKILLALLLLSSFSFAAKIPVPAAYDQHMTIISTRLVFDGETCSNEVTILKNSGNIELSGQCMKAKSGNYGLLKLGGYSVRLVADDKSTPYLTEQTYEFFLADGTKWSAQLIGK